MPSGIATCVAPMEEEIGRITTVDHDDADPMDELAATKIDENRDIMDLEKRDFNDEKGIEEEVDEDN
jgi:hypothetical protein